MTPSQEKTARTIHGLALCRAAAVDVADGGTSLWFQMVPAPGEYTLDVVVGGKLRRAQTLLVDAQVIARLQAAFAADVPDESAPGLLLDREHLSLQPNGDSTALGWIKALRVEPDGSLYARCDLTPMGAQAHQDKLYLYRSPVLDLEPAGDARWRPTRLASAAMTNMPQFDCLSPAALAARAAGANEEEQTMTLFERLRALLALPDAATEDECYAEVEKRLATATEETEALAQARARVHALESADLDRQAEAFVAEFKDRITDAPAVRAAFRKDPATTRVIVGAFRAAPGAEAPARVIARESARTPGDREAQTDAAAQVVARRNVLVSALVRDEGISHRDAMARCRQQHPELFAAG